MAAAPVKPDLSGRRFTKLGAGTFGAVISPALPNVKEGAVVEYPDNVTKLFFKRDDKERLMENMEHVIPRVMGVHPEHRINNYEYRYKIRNLPSSVTNILSKESRRALRLDDSIYPVRMPNLGFDLTDKNLMAHYKELRNIPVVKIISEIVKLLEHTANLAEDEYVHGDIRDTNVMISPVTGVMTLIDFDWVREYYDFLESYSFGFYNNPPEYLMMEQFQRLVDDDYMSYNEVDEIMDEDQLVNYSRHNFQRFKAFWQSTKEFESRSDLQEFIVEENAHNARTLGDKVHSMMRHNYNDTGDAIKDLFQGNLEYFDNFGLGLTLLCLLKYLYPGSVQLTDVHEDEVIDSEIKAYLKDRITDNGRKYSDEELDVIIPAIQKISYLLSLVAHTRIQFRPTPKKALKEARTILGELSNGLAAVNSRVAGNELARMAVMEGNLSALRAIEGGRRRTYRRRHQRRRKSTRRNRK